MSSPQKGVRHQKCEAPFGPFRFLVSDPFSLATPKSKLDEALGVIKVITDEQPQMLRWNGNPITESLCFQKPVCPLFPREITVP